MEQQTFEFVNTLPDSAQEAMERVDDHADPDWKAILDECIIAAARKKQEITSDDALTEWEVFALSKWEVIPDRLRIQNLAALGPAMKRAAKDGVLSSTHRVERSTRAVKHGIRHTVWHSNIYREDL